VQDEPLSEDRETLEPSGGEQPEDVGGEAEEAHASAEPPEEERSSEPPDEVPLEPPEEGTSESPDEESPSQSPDPSAALEEDENVEPAAAAPRARLVPWWPFIILLLLWLGLAGGAVALLREAAVAGEARWTREYDLVVTIGVVLTGLAPLMSLGVWLVARIRAEVDARAGLLVSALLRGALVTTLGVALWVGALVVLDLLSNGRLVF
jgi:hypothetical protein